MMAKKVLQYFIIAGVTALSIHGCAAPQNGEIQSPTQDAAANPDKLQETESGSEQSVSFMTRAAQFTADTAPLPSPDPWIEAANNGDHEAQFVLSMMYRENLSSVDHIQNGEPSDDAVDMEHEMYRWLGESIDYGCYLSEITQHPTLEYVIAAHDKNKDYSKAINWLEEAAKRGLRNSEFVLGILYYNGAGVAQNKEKGQELIGRAAFHDLPMAQYYVGMMYEMGIGTEVDKEKALEWFKKAADQDNADASFVLALKYLDGIDVEQNNTQYEQYHKMYDYHAWGQLISGENAGRFDQVCMFDYDKATLGHEEYDDCGGGEGLDDEEPDEDEIQRRKEYEIETRADESLPYSVDYQLAAKWLDKQTESNHYLHAAILRAQTLTQSGCRGNDDSSYATRRNKAIELLESVPTASFSESDRGYLEFTRASLIHNGLSEYDDDCEGSDCSNTENAWNAQRAFELYQSAASHSNLNAMNVLGDIYYEIDYPVHIGEKIGMPEDLEKAYEWYSKAGNHSRAIDMADMLANRAASQKNNDKTIYWIEKKIEHGSTNAIFALGRIYKEGKLVPKDDKKAIEYYLKGISENDSSPFNFTYVIDEIMELAGIYALTDKAESLKWYKSAYERANSNIFPKKPPYGFVHVINAIENQPKINGLQTALENQIKLEKDKALKEFFVYKSGLSPCTKDPKSCRETIQPLFDESIQKAIRAITALTIVQKGSADLQIIENTYYYMAAYLGRHVNYNEQLKGMSPVPEAIYTTEKLNTYDRKMLFYIWFLRQIPYAAKEIYDYQPKEKSWDNYLKEADKAIAGSEQLKTAFGIDLMKYYTYYLYNS